MICKRNKCYVLIIIFTLFLVDRVEAQLTDLARLEYSFIPSSKSDDQYTRLRAILNYPIKLKEKDYLIVGAEYNRIILNLEDDYPFITKDFNRLHIIDLNFGYTFKCKNDWRLGVNLNPRIASTLTNSLASDDLFLNGGVFAIKDRTAATVIDKPYRLVLGLTYNTTAGLPYPLPFISYFRQVNEKWSFNVGVPKSNLKYTFNKRSNLQAFASLDGYFANIQEPMLVGDKLVDNISLSVAVGGLGYEYCFTKHIVAYSYIGYTFRLNNVLRNGDRDEVFKLDDLNAFYLRTGLKFKI